jgi:hypothetical protein
MSDTDLLADAASPDTGAALAAVSVGGTVAGQTIPLTARRLDMGRLSASPPTFSVWSAVSPPGTAESSERRGLAPEQSPASAGNQTRFDEYISVDASQELTMVRDAAPATSFSTPNAINTYPRVDADGPATGPWASPISQGRTGDAVDGWDTAASGLAASTGQFNGSRVVVTSAM